MSQKKRSRDGPTDDSTDARDHLACDQCRVKKIRCGKERPNCSNCTRMNLDCNWSGHGKKPNQTVVLNKSISTIGERLRLIEGNISGIQRSLQRLDSAVASRPSFSGIAGLPHDDVVSSVFPGTATAGGGSSPTKAASEQGSSSSSSIVSDMSPGRYHVLHDAQGYERCVGPTSLLSLIHNIDDLSMPEPEGAGGNTAAAREKIKELGYSTTQPPLFSSHIDSPPAIQEPPILIVEALIDPYFDSINAHLPIWTREGFRRMLEASRTESNPAVNKPFAICANNMILLTLTAKALHSRAKSTTATNMDPVAESIDVELIRSFIGNANRAMVQVERLLSPRLINVQALLSLCFVAQMWLCEDVFSLTLTLAAHVAKSMGLYQPQATSLSASRLSPEEIQERRNVMHCLYYLDKAVCWNIGSLPSVSGDVVMAAATMKLPDDTPTLMDAKFALAQIEDESYTVLYSKNPTLQDQIALKTRSVHARLQEWRAAYHLDEQNASRLPLCWRLELDISFHHARMRLMWPFVGEPEARALLLQDCRTSLHLLQQLWAATTEHDHYPSFAWLTVSFPTNVIFQFASQLEGAESAMADLGLLTFLSNSLQNISMFATENSYVTRFSSFVRILVRLAQDIVDSRAGTPPDAGIPDMFTTLPQAQRSDEDAAAEHMYQAAAAAAAARGGPGGLQATMQETMNLHEDLDSLMTMWENGTNSFAAFHGTNDLMAMNDFSPNGDKGMWDHFNLTNDLDSIRDPGEMMQQGQ